MIKRYKDQKQYRRKGYNYSQDGFYFVTICTKDQEEFFGDVINGKMVLSKMGIIADKFWQEIAVHFLFVKLYEYIIMPNHVHGVIQIDNDSYRINQRTGHDINQRTGHDINQRTGQCPVRTGRDDEINDVGTRHCLVRPSNRPIPTNSNNYKAKFGYLRPKSLSSIIGSYKSIVTKIIKLQMPDYEFTWQPRFHDRIIRNNDELNKIRQYIIDNPGKWEFDRNNPDNDVY